MWVFPYRNEKKFLVCLSLNDVALATLWQEAALEDSPALQLSFGFHGLL